MNVEMCEGQLLGVERRKAVIRAMAGARVGVLSWVEVSFSSQESVNGYSFE